MNLGANALGLATVLLLASAVCPQDHMVSPHISDDAALPDLISPTVWPPPAPRGASQPSTSLNSVVSANELRIPSAAMKELRQFQRNFRSGKLADSVKHLEKAIQIYPHLPAAHQNLGVCYARLHEYDKAVAEFESAAALDAHSIQPEISLSAALFMQARDSEAEAAARRALEIDPTNPAARYLLGRALAAEDRDTQETVKLLRESGAEYPVAHLVLASFLLKHNSRDDAVAELRQYLKGPGLPQEEQHTAECLVEKLTQSPGSSACSSK